MRYSHVTLVWFLIVAMAAVTALSLALTGIGLDLTSNPATGLAIGALFAVSVFYRTARPNPQLSDITCAAGQMLLILLLGALLTYPAAALDFPLRDPQLHMIDQALGLSRSAYLAFFHSRPWLLTAIGVAYVSFLPQFAITLLLLFVNDQMPRLRTMMFATGVSLVLTGAISAFTPALDAVVYLDFTPAEFAKVSQHIQTQVPVLEALRAGAMHAIRLDALDGLVTFPSFHTVAGLLFMWALWPVPLVRWLGLALNMAMIAATPVVGSHYFIDIAGGVGVAVISILVSEWICRGAAVPEANAQCSPTPSWRRLIPGWPWPRHAPR